jgi:phytoene dehydrogenase-like protein
LDEDRVIMLERSVEATAKQFATDAAAYSDLVSPFVEGFDQLLPMILAPLSLPSHPLLMARFGGVALRSMTGLARSRFDGAEAAALLGAGSRLPPSYRARLERFRYGPGVFKIDWALSAPIPWRNPGCARAATVHLSGALPEMAKAQQLPSNGKFAERPFTLLVQPTLFDETRAPAAMHTAWAYCHVPAGSPLDATDAIEEQVERFAPGFRRQILAKSAKNALEMQRYNANYVGGDINGGMANLAQLFFRPAPRVDPYSTPATDIFLCSSSTPPGGGVHGMCGYWAARSVLKHAFQRAG